MQVAKEVSSSIFGCAFFGQAIVVQIFLPARRAEKKGKKSFLSHFQCRGEPRGGDCRSVRTSRTTTTRMINLFGNNEESKRRRDALSFRDAQAGQRKAPLTFFLTRDPLDMQYGNQTKKKGKYN